MVEDLAWTARCLVKAEELLGIDVLGPSIVVIEKPLRKATDRAALMLAQELRARSRELGLTLREITPLEVRRVVIGDPQATKLTVARSLAMRFPQL